MRAPHLLGKTLMPWLINKSCATAPRLGNASRLRDEGSRKLGSIHVEPRPTRIARRLRHKTRARRGAPQAPNSHDAAAGNPREQCNAHHHEHYQTRIHRYHPFRRRNKTGQRSIPCPVKLGLANLNYAALAHGHRHAVLHVTQKLIAQAIYDRHRYIVQPYVGEHGARRRQ